MPLPKPDKELVRRILRERQTGFWPDDIFTPIQDAALGAIGDGAITPARANNLVWALETNPHLASVFPNNVLLCGLLRVLEPGSWTDSSEHDLLVFIFAFYSETQDIEDSLQAMMAEPLPLFGDIYPAIFDTPDAPISLTGKICDFTGSFACGTRRKCFEMAACGGGAASEGGPGTDYLFVAEKHVADRVISGAIRDALRRRRDTGMPKIYAERHFPGGT